MTLTEAINRALPQTQCTRCGYPDCIAYANAIASGDAPINQCPPGGQAGVARLAAITGQPELPLNPEHGHEGPRHLAVIDEDWCIGCTLCMKACPTDAIAGANKTMHVILNDYCTGCELCIPVCPVDCISLQDVTSPATGWAAWSAEQARTAQNRYMQRAQRLGFDAGAALPPLQQRTGLSVAKLATGTATAHGSDLHAGSSAASEEIPAADKSATLAAIMAKARARRAQPPS